MITPGLDLSGKFAKTGIPASIVTKFLAEHGVVVEKTGLYSFFIMFTIGITKGRWNTLLTALQQFKDDYDKNAPMWRMLPEFCAAHPRYERMGLRDLCQAIHEMYAKGDIARLTTEMYLSDLHPAMKPSDAYAHIAHRKTERVGIDALEGRITTSLLTPYPPGIPLLIPGERFNRKIVDYLRFTREFNAAFPGFDTDVHGLVEDDGPGGRRKLLRGLRAGRAERPAACPKATRPEPAGSARRGIADADVAEAAVHVGDLGGDAGGQVGHQEGRHVAHVVDGDVAAHGRGGGATAPSSLPKSLMPEAASVLIGPAEMPLTRTPRAPRLCRQVAHAGFQRGLGQAHGVVVGHHALRPGRSASAARRRRAAAGRGLGQRREAVGRDVVRDAEAFSRVTGLRGSRRQWPRAARSRWRARSRRTAARPRPGH